MSGAVTEIAAEDALALDTVLGQPGLDDRRA
jgi:hypothetical protein